MSLLDQLAGLARRIADEINGLVRPDHPGLARAWASFGWDGKTLRLHAAHGVASVKRLSTGRYRLTFAAPLGDDAYCWLATARSAKTRGPLTVSGARLGKEAKTPARLEILCASASGTPADAPEISVAVFR